MTMQDRRAVITQGEYLVSGETDLVITTLLGSCVACCMWDPMARVGGMNHILLANSSQQSAQCDLAGVNAMELVINDMLKIGARRERLVAKLFGGAQMVSGLSDIGPSNCAFALNFLSNENIEVVAQSLGGDAARQLMFWPASGAARQKAQRQAPDVLSAPIMKPAPAGNDLELL